MVTTIMRMVVDGDDGVGDDEGGIGDFGDGGDVGGGCSWRK